MSEYTDAEFEKDFQRIAKFKDVVKVTRCKDCEYWDRDTLRHMFNDFREWNEAECKVLAERDGYNEIDRFVEADDYCSRGELRG